VGAVNDRVRVAVVDDDPLVRSALKLMLGGHASIEVIGEADDGRSALRLVEEHSPDVVLMDIRMPRMDGLEATGILRGRPRPPRVIVLTTFDGDEYVVRALEAGAAGFLLKDTPPEKIVDAVLTVADGDPMLSPAVTRTLIGRIRDRQDQPDDSASAARQRLAVLTEREYDVALAVGRGLSNAEIAAELHLSVPTVKAHVSRLFDKLEVGNRVQIAICVHDAGVG
jgi:DNA-binding NarL/FixJ family response regulator